MSKFLGLSSYTPLIDRLFKNKLFSLSKLYLYFSALVITITIFTSTLFSYFSYEKYEREQMLYLQQQTYKLNIEFYEKINFTENIVKFLAEKIVESNDYSYENIAFLIKHQRNKLERDLFTWTLLDYVNAQGLLVIDSIFGIRKQPIDISNYDRQWLKTASKKPWKMHFSIPSVGIISKERIISTGFGITDENGQFKGYLSAAINIEKLNNTLSVAVNKDIAYILLDDKMNFILSSNPLISKENIKIKQNIQYEILKAKHIDPKALTTPIKIHNYIFSLNVNTDVYPYVFLVGRDKTDLYSQFKKDMVPQIARNIFLGIFFVIILLFLSSIIIKPIIILSNVVDSITNNKSIKMPNFFLLEINNLATQLLNINRMTKDLRQQQELLVNTNSSLKSANEFIKSNMSFLSHELKNNVSSLIGFAKLLKNEIDNQESEEQKEFINNIYDIALYQNKQIIFFLKLFKFQEKGKVIENENIDLKEVIINNVDMIRYQARAKNVKIILEISDELPLMIGDKIMIGQMIQNFSINGIKYNKMNGHLYIKASSYYINRKRCVIIQFKDTGIGIKKSKMNVLFDKFERDENDKNADIIGYGLGLAFAKNCVELHDGRIEVKSEIDIGTIFTVTFPRSRIVKSKIFIKNN